ncbi:MAG: hypothetical protein ACE5IB_06915 [Candidatus Geothermarchaeales archaeon]
MRTSLKIGLALVVSLALFSVFVFAQPPAYAPDDFAPAEGGHDFLARDADELRPLQGDAFHPQMRDPPKERFLRALLSGHAEPADVGGVFQGFAGNLMVLDTGDGIISVVLPHAWAVDGDVVPLPGLLLMGALNEGNSVEVQVLRMTIGGGDDAGYTVYVLFGYSIYDVDTGTRMDAILPFNIEVAG